MTQIDSTEGGTNYTMTRDEWISRYAAHMQKQLGCSDRCATELAEVGAQSYKDMYGNLGVPPDCFWSDPEEEADAELSCWTNDGDDDVCAGDE